MPLLDPLTVYPSLQIHQGLEQNFVRFQYPLRRREDDASDDALTASRRFSSPSHCRAVKEMEPLLMDPVVPVRGPVYTTPPLCHIPECVVIPRMKLKMDGRHDDVRQVDMFTMIRTMDVVHSNPSILIIFQNDAKVFLLQPTISSRTMMINNNNSRSATTTSRWKFDAV